MEESERFGPYVLLRELGRGGQGIVWLAKNEKLGRRVALKVLNPGSVPGSITDREVARFRREAEAASKLDHPNICALIDAGEVEGVPFLAFRHVEGETLVEKVERAASVRRGESSGDTDDADPSSKEGIGRIVAIFEKIARALHKAHEKGLIHRDIKPGNIMLDDEGEPVVLDFGLARAEIGDGMSLTNSGELLGTPAYMSPEQLMAHRVPLDRRTDIYSLGATLYECLTLQKPFTGLTRAELYQQILHAEPSASGSLNRQIPRDLQVVLDTAIEKDRDRRYQSALDLAEDLRRLRAFEPIRARPIGRWLRARRWVQRHPVISASLAGFAVALSLTLVLLIQSRDKLRVSRALLIAAESAKVAQSDQLLSVLLARRAVQLDENPATISQLHAALADVHERLTFRHGARVSCVALAPDEDSVLVGSEAGDLSLWTFGESPPTLFDGHEGIINTVEFSRDGKTILSADRSSWRIFDRDGNPRFKRPGYTASGVSATFGPEDRLVLVTGGNAVRMWTADGEEKYLLDHRAPVVCARFSPNGQHFATAVGWGWRVNDQECAVRVWNTETGDLVHTLVGHRRGIWDVQFSPDGKLVATSSSDRTVRVWSVESGALVCKIEGHNDYVLSVDFSPDGQQLLTGCMDRTARLWDLAGVEVARVHVPEGVVVARFSPLGDRFAIGAWDASVRLFDLTGAELIEFRGHRHAITHGALLFFRDGKRLLTGSLDNTARVWDVALRQMPVLRRPRRHFRSARFSLDGRRVLTASAEGPVTEWNLANGTERIVVERGKGGWEAVYSADGEFVLTGSPRIGKDARLVRLRDGSETILEGHAGKVYWTAFAPDGRPLTAAMDLLAILWNRRGDIQQKFEHPSGCNPIHSVAMHGDFVLTTASDHKARIWNLDGTVRTRLIGHSDRLYMAEFSSDGKLVLTCSPDTTARIWDLDGNQREVLHHTAAVSSARFSPDDKRIVTASRDGSVRVWDREGKELFSLRARNGAAVLDAAFDVDGRRIVTAGADGTVRVWLANPDDVKGLAAGFRELTPAELDRYKLLLGL